MLLFPVFVSCLFAQAEPQVSVLETTLNVWDVASSDINGDGLTDILALCSDEDSDPLKKEIAVFLATAAGKFPAKPDLSFALAPESGTVLLSEVDGTPGKEIVVTRATGAQVFRFSGGRMTLLSETNWASLLPSHSKEPLFLPNAAMDLDGDGIDEWVIPGLESYEIWRASGVVRALQADVVSELQPYANPEISTRLPAILPFDQEGLPNKGLAFLSNRNADFAYGADWSEHMRYRIPLQIDDQWDSTARMVDINNDGFPDLIVTQTKGTVKLKVVTQVYVATKPLTYPEKPTATFEMNGALTSPYLADVDGDEQMDLVMVHIPFGVGAFVNFFVRNKLSVKAEVYLFDGETYPQEPNYKNGLTLEAPDGRDQVAFAMGDFNGDKRLDVAFAADTDQFVFHEGAGNDFVRSRPFAKLAIPAFGVARKHDLNGNEKDDVILHHPSGETRTRIEVIVF